MSPLRDRDPEEGIQPQDPPGRPVMAGIEHQRRRGDRDQDVGLGGEIAEEAHQQRHVTGQLAAGAGDDSDALQEQHQLPDDARRGHREQHEVPQR